MFAIVKHGGKQYMVKPGFTVLVEKIDAEEGHEFVFDNVVLSSNGGSVVFNNAKVSAVVVRQVVEKKVTSFKKRRRHFGSKRTKGHRQKQTLVLVKSIE